MENATQALIIVFSVLVFVMALTVTIVSFNNAKNAADVILYTKDETNYYDYINVSGKADENRIVGLEAIIPTLYNYYNEDYTIVFKKGKYNKNDGTFDSWEYLPVYQTKVPVSSGKIQKNWQNSYVDYMKDKYNIEDNSEINNMINEGKIFSFDQYEEFLRYEPWRGSKDRAKINVDCFLYGKIYKNPEIENSNYIDYSDSSQPTPFSLHGFIEKCSSEKYTFVETIKEYEPNTIDKTVKESDEDSNRASLASSSTKDKSKRMIIFTLIED